MNSDYFLGEIAVCAFNFAPKGWAFCEGQVMPISQNTALFALLGVTYGGDGKTTFALPDLRGRTVMGHGQGPGLSDRWLGEQAGVDSVTLLPHEIPRHSHTVQVSTEAATSGDPAGRLLAVRETRTFRAVAPDASLAPASLGTAGGSLPHENRQPYLALSFVIALQGVFPPRG
ncbi:phage tail protein [Nocardioides sp. SYSU DS0663]|uniref:phage tail protein n=1 Tax=Nocardioides sp. SYSU DS0663 TaxID=3416445 RepID=UPI003F4C4D4D